MNDWLHIARGEIPLIVSIPHAGTRLTPEILNALVDPDAALADTDWHVDRLYAFAADLGATIVRTDISRIVIDMNRDPSGTSLYPGQATTGLCPTTRFDGAPLYRLGCEPDDEEIARRREDYLAPYHAALDAEAARLRAAHPAIVVYDAHSIVSRAPRLFEGELPLFNIGSNDGATCDPALTETIACYCGTDHVINGRFRGGWITRRLGAPADGVHAVQMELAQRGYLTEPSTDWDAARAAPLQRVLRSILQTCIDFAKDVT